MIAGTHQVSSMSADVGMYYHDDKRVQLFQKKCTMMAGISISNIGPKISYSDASQTNFIPTNLRVGQGLLIHLNGKNELTFQYDFNKLLVPTPPQYALDANGSPFINPNTGQYVIAAGKDPNVNMTQGMIQSFYDAPRGFKEELEEIYFSGGTEYTFNRTVFARMGYFYESPNKGNRQFMTLGAGLKFNNVSVDFAYLVVTNGQRNPLQNTMRFTAHFDFDKFPRKKIRH
jgi:hypothetical protein